MLKKTILIALAGSALLLTGCNNTVRETETIAVRETESATYLIAGRYYTNGELFTEDGNSWEYSQDIISEEPSYDNEPVFALIDNMGTGNKYDDKILGLVLDKETAIYDELEARFAEEFNVERNGNVLHIAPGQ